MSDDNGSKTIYSTEKLAEGLKLAREARGKTITESSQLLGISASRLRNYENGKFIPSLPELELLAYIYDIPLPILLDPDALSLYIHTPDSEQLKKLLEIRQRVIATRLQIAREKTGKTFKELSTETSIPVSRLKRYENGMMSISFDDLERLANALGLTLEEFQDKESPLGLWQVSQVQKTRFSNLPQEIQSFCLSTDNQPFIAFTQKLKAIGVENFSKLSDSIQEIIKVFNQKD